MIQNQCINAILSRKDSTFITENNLTDEFFSDYKDEFNFINSHIKEYGNVPDIETFISKFPTFDLVDVHESPKYLLSNLIEDRNQRYLANTFNIIRKKLMNDDTESAIQLYKNIYDNLNITSAVSSVNILNDLSRYDYYLDVQNDWRKHYVSTGFSELDELFGGWDRLNDYVIVAGRPGTGKSWILLKMAISAAQQGLRVGYYSGEMSEIAVGQRADSLIGHFNLGYLMRGNESIQNDYKRYFENLPSMFGDGCLNILTPVRVNGPVTVSALQSFIEKDKLDILFIDQLSLLEDERRGRSFVEQASNISKDLKKLQSMKEIPIICASQANRASAESGIIGTENIAQSDRISQDASIVVAIQRDREDLNLITLRVAKSRNSISGSQIHYKVNFSDGTFEHVIEADSDDAEELENRYSGTEVFNV